MLKLKEFDCDQCKDALLLTKQQIDEPGNEDLPYLFTLYLTRGGLRFVGIAVFDLAQMAIKFFKHNTSTEKLLEIQASAGIDGVSEKIAKLFCETAVCQALVKETLPACHCSKLALKLATFLMTSICKRKLRLINSSRITKDIIYAGKTALMRTNPFVENKGISKAYNF